MDDLVDAHERLMRNEPLVDILAVHAHPLAVGDDAGHEARLVHVEEAQELEVVSPRCRTKAHTRGDDVMNRIDRAMRREALAQRNERVVDIGEYELDHGKPLVEVGCLTLIIRAVGSAAGGNLGDDENMTP